MRMACSLGSARTSLTLHLILCGHLLVPQAIVWISGTKKREHCVSLTVFGIPAGSNQ